MSKITILKFACDICNEQSDEGNGDPLPKGWVHFSQDNPMEDRTWIERYICPSCIQDIQQAIKKK